MCIVKSLENIEGQNKENNKFYHSKNNHWQHFGVYCHSFTYVYFYFTLTIQKWNCIAVSYFITCLLYLTGYHRQLSV